MLSLYIPQGRRSARVMSKRRASLVINLDRKPKRFPCLVLDSSKEGFRVRGSFDLRRGQVLELILDEDMLNPERCRVVWVEQSRLQAGGRSRPGNRVGGHPGGSPTLDPQDRLWVAYPFGSGLCAPGAPCFAFLSYAKRGGLDSTQPRTQNRSHSARALACNQHFP